MAKIIKSELYSSNITSMISSLAKEITDTDNLITEINNFINNSKTTLKGESYNEARKKASEYIPLLNQRKAIAESLKEAISNAKTTMVGFMEDYDSLDDSNLEEIRAKFNQAAINLEQAKEDYVKDYQNNTKSISTSPITLGTDYIKYLSSYIATYMKAKELKEKLEALSSTDASAFSQIQSAGTQVSNYQSSVNSMDVSNITITVEL